MSRSMGIGWFGICSVSDHWSSTIEDIFSDRNLSKSKQYVFRMESIDEEKLDLKKSHEDIKICPASKDYFKKNFININYFMKDILTFWDSIDEFCEKGFGYFLVKDNIILSRCTLDFKYGNVCTLGVSTDSNHRKKGYARRVVSELLRYCKEKGFDPYWDCMESNIGSQALAKSVGFEKDYTYSFYEFKFE